MPALVTTDVTRITACEAADDSNWDNIGGGAGSGQSDDVFIQGAASRGRRVDNARRGFLFDNGSGIDVTDGDHIGMWIQLPIPEGIDTDGLNISLGTTVANRDEFTAFDTGEYPDRGGWVRVWLDPQRGADETFGTGATLTTIQHFGAHLDMINITGIAFTLYVDTIDKGTGLTITGSPSSYADFAAFDPGTLGNRYGFMSATAGDDIFQCSGTLQIGTAATAVTFSDEEAILIFADGLMADGFNRILIDLQNAGTTVTHDSAIVGLLPVTGTNPDFTVVGTAGTLDLGGSLRRIRTMTLTSAVTARDCIISAERIIQGSADIEECVITTLDDAGRGTIRDPDFTNLHDILFLRGLDGHAFELDTTGTYTLHNLRYTGYGADAATDAVLFNDSGGLVTLNIVEGGDVPTVRNGAGASTVINQTWDLTIGVFDVDTSLLVPDCEITVTDDSATPVVLFHVENSVTGQEVYTFPVVDAGNTIVVLVIKPGPIDPKVPLNVTGSLPNIDSQITLLVSEDRVEFNPP